MPAGRAECPTSATELRCTGGIIVAHAERGDRREEERRVTIAMPSGLKSFNRSLSLRRSLPAPRGTRACAEGTWRHLGAWKRAGACALAGTSGTWPGRRRSPSRIVESAPAEKGNGPSRSFSLDAGGLGIIHEDPKCHLGSSRKTCLEQARPNPAFPRRSPGPRVTWTAAPAHTLRPPLRPQARVVEGWMRCPLDEESPVRRKALRGLQTVRSYVYYS